MKNIYAKIIRRSLTKWQIKVFLAFFAFAMVISVLLYTQKLAHELIEREKRIVTFYADIYKHYLFDSKRIRVYDGNVEILYNELFVVDLYDICGVNFEVMNEVNHRILLGFYVEVDFIDDFVSEIIF